MLLLMLVVVLLNRWNRLHVVIGGLHHLLSLLILLNLMILFLMHFGLAVYNLLLLVARLDRLLVLHLLIGTLEIHLLLHRLLNLS